MLRFIKHNLTTIDGVDIYPLLSLLIFTIFFLVVLFRVIKMKKDEVAELSNLAVDTVEDRPLDFENKDL